MTKLSKSMQKSHTRMFLARGTHRKTHIKNISANLANPFIPLKIKLYQARKWAGKIKWLS